MRKRTSPIAIVAAIIVVFVIILVFVGMNRHKDDNNHQNSEAVTSSAESESNGSDMASAETASDTDNSEISTSLPGNVAKEDLESAYLTFEAGQFRAANNRAYYSIFHTICAILAKEGVAFKKHKDTLSYFNKNYVQPEIIHFL